MEQLINIEEKVLGLTSANRVRYYSVGGCPIKATSISLYIELQNVTPAVPGVDENDPGTPEVVETIMGAQTNRTYPIAANNPDWNDLETQVLADFGLTKVV